jgi:thiol-disulfide isomerase/thioredoxin
VLVLMLVAACVATIAVPVSARAPARAAAAPSFTLPARSGSLSLDSLRGHVVYLDFWASWCGPCRASFPWMAGLAQRYKAKGLRIVAVNLDKDRSLADDFLSRYPAAFDIAFDPSGRTAEAYKVAAMPTSFVIGKDGAVVLRHAGFEPRRTAEVEKSIQEALAR